MGYITRGLLAALTMPAIAGGTKTFLNNAGKHTNINPGLKDPISLAVAVAVGVLIVIGDQSCKCACCKKKEETEDE